MTAYVILSLGLLFFLAHGLSLFFAKSKIPDVLLLIILGIVAGPILKLVTVEDFGAVGPIATSIALVVILFEGGTTLDLRTLAATFNTTVRLTFITFIVSVIIAALCAYYLVHLPIAQSIFLACAVAGTSSAVVIPLARMLKLTEDTETTLVIESALTDVLCIVTAFATLGTILGGDVDPGKLIGATLASLTFAAAIGIGGGLAWLLVLDTVRQFPNTRLTTVAFTFVLFGLAEILGFSGAIAALAFGIALTNQELLFGRIKHVQSQLAMLTMTEKQFFGEMVFLLKTLFFLYLGISLKFSNVQTAFTATALVASIYLARLPITLVTIPRTTSRREAAVVSIMVPKGLAAAVLAGVPLTRGVEGGAAIQDTVYMVVLISITITAILTPLLENGMLNGLYNLLLKPFPEVGTQRNSQADARTDSTPPTAT